MREYQCWKRCENSVIAIIFEMGKALPDHRVRLEWFYDTITAFEKILEKHQSNQLKTRTTYIDDQCPCELQSLKQIGVSRCLQCEPQCVDGLLAMHRKIELMYVEIRHKYDRLKNEYEMAVPEIKALEERLHTCLGKAEQAEVIMVHLDLTDKESSVLHAALESYLSDLRYEIGNTDNLNYRNDLKAEKAVLRKVADALVITDT